MSEGKYKYRTAKLKKKQRIKEISIKTLTTVAILILVVFCIVMFSWVYLLHQKLNDMTVRIDNLTQLITEQQEQLQQWKDVNAVEVQGTAVDGQAQSMTGNGESLTENTTEDKAGDLSDSEAAEDGSLTEQESGADDSVTEAESNPVALSAAQLQGKRKVYLTFDDGPSIYTDDILAILDKYQVKATFFVIGKEGAEAEEALQSIVAGGHTLGLHSYSHDYDKLYESVEAFAEDFTRLQNYVYEVTGVQSKFFRFPGGSSNTISDVKMQEFINYLESQGVEYYDWSISAGDGGSITLDAQTIVKNCTRNYDFYNNVTILLHDSADKPTTVEALPLIIENILAMEDTVIMPITEDTVPVQHIDTKSKE